MNMLKWFRAFCSMVRFLTVSSARNIKFLIPHAKNIIGLISPSHNPIAQSDTPRVSRQAHLVPDISMSIKCANPQICRLTKRPGMTHDARPEESLENVS
ncbi:hypothetical protein P167DRAFT_118748 [Morchella conica CCBAS932]|uniref:Secreted protein n=1 Tax=Morchella conica CCBAS932 TaxID=1392247 RepID=A0A3N4L2T6_9PEZI|nr:hypothetical protein P167DRAFT_118748 [Morchella conica CCBAS932]